MLHNVWMCLVEIQSVLYVRIYDGTNKKLGLIDLFILLEFQTE